MKFMSPFDLLPSKLKWWPIFKECTPKLLVVTDGLNFNPNDGFGLTQFISTLEASTIHGMTPEVIKATRGSDANADINGFEFDHADHGVRKSRYDVVFLFGIWRENTNPLSIDEINAMAQFMEDGGGVFATGDHEDLGASISQDIPRVRSMRYWTAATTPDVSDTSRLSTNLPGDDATYSFADQSDTHPQRLYLNWRTEAGGIDEPHPLLADGPHGAVEVFPDHPHEGECRVPTDLTTTFALGGGNRPEWPDAVGGGSLAPEIVAMSMSHGDAFPGKQSLAPRAFAAISAYDGHEAGVGRVATDATWHHFVNINLDGKGSARDGLMDPPGTDTEDLEQIRQYYRNLGTWLMPRNVRRCLRYPLVIKEIFEFPLIEELKIPWPPKPIPDGPWPKIGSDLKAALAIKHGKAMANAVAADALADAVGVEAAARLRSEARKGDWSGLVELENAALGALVAASIETFVELADKVKAEERKDCAKPTPRSPGADKAMQELDASFDARVKKLASNVVASETGRARERAQRLGELLGALID